MSEQAAGGVSVLNRKPCALVVREVRVVRHIPHCAKNVQLGGCAAFFCYMRLRRT
jgi:hypothetical protein